ncbi:PEP-CTERM sorting domain-containing protein [Planctomycetota bacterium]|nr:PEP-CTERM sorting domain-containing protein [Planctomycetota bacterium]
MHITKLATLTAAGLLCASGLSASTINGTLDNDFLAKDLSVTEVVGGDAADMNSIPDVVDWSYWRATTDAVAPLDPDNAAFSPPAQEDAYFSITKDAGIISNTLTITKSNDSRGYGWWSFAKKPLPSTYKSSANFSKHNAGWFFSDGDGPVFQLVDNGEGELVEEAVERDEDSGRLGVAFAKSHDSSVTADVATTVNLDAGDYTVYLFMNNNGMTVDLTAALDDGAATAATTSIITSQSGDSIKGKHVWELNVSNDSAQALTLTLGGAGIAGEATNFNIDGIVVTQVIPEPASLVLLGLGGLLALKRRK